MWNVYYYYFSEENVWCLCDRIRDKYPDRLHNCYCVFISNNKRAVCRTEFFFQFLIEIKCKKNNFPNCIRRENVIFSYNTCLDPIQWILYSSFIDICMYFYLSIRSHFGDRKQVKERMVKLYGQVSCLSRIIYWWDTLKRTENSMGRHWKV